MFIKTDPTAGDGIIKVYMKMKTHDEDNDPIDHSGYGHRDPSTPHPDNSDYKLFYRTSIDRSKNAISSGEDTHLHLQSHWGSEVKFTNVDFI